MSSPASASYFERSPGYSVNPLFVLRGFLIAILASVLLALTVFKTSPAHNFCLGIAVGLLIGVTMQLFSIQSVALKNDTRRPGVEDLSLTR